MNTCIVCGKEVHGDDGYATDGKIFVCRKCTEIETLRTITVHIGNSGVDSNLVYKREAPIEMESSLVNQTKATIDYIGGFSIDAAINHIYDECEQIWYETHDKSEVHSKFTERVKELEARTGKTAEKLGIYEPNFENSEAPIEVESSLVNQTDEVESSLVNQTASSHVELDKAYIDERDGSTIPNGCSKDCPYYPYDTCGHYYGEIHECMLEEEENSMPKAEIVPKEEYEGEIDADIENMSEEDFMSKYCDDGYAIGKWVDAHSDDPAFTNI